MTCHDLQQTTVLTIILPMCLSWECRLFYLCCIYAHALQTAFVMEANNANPDRSSLICVSIVSNVGCLSKLADEKEYYIWSEWRENSGEMV